MKRLISLLLIISVLFSVNLTTFAEEKEESLTIAVVGDDGVKAYVDDANPSLMPGSICDLLDAMLGRGIDVKNFGKKGACVLESSKALYTGSPEYKASQRSDADMVFIMLGQSDAKEEDVSSYAQALSGLIEKYTALPTSPEVYLMLPPPLFSEDSEMAAKLESIVKATKEVGEKLSIPVLDTNSPFINRKSDFPDGVNFNSAIANEIAQIMADTIRGTEKFISFKEKISASFDKEVKNYGPAEDDVIAKALGDMGFIEGEGNYVTRADYAKMLLKMLNVPHGAYSGENPFSDISVDDVNYAVMTSGYALGIFSGGVAAPNRSVTVNEALKMTICALGYAPLAQVKGGWPSGYTALGQELRLLKGISGAGSEEMTREEVNRLFYNALSTEVFSIVGISDKVTYDTFEGVTPLSLYHKIYSAKGVLQGTQEISILPSANLKNGSIVIDSRIYNTDILNISDFVGADVTYYFGADDNRVYAIVPQNTTICTLNAENVLNFADNTLTVADGLANAKYLFSTDTVIIYNGEVVESFSPSDFMDKNGTVKLIDNGRNGVYDCAVINSYDVCVVGGIDAYSETVFDLYSADKNLNLSEKDGKKVVFVDESGKEKKVGELMLGDVITYSKSKSGKTILAYFGNREISGEIETVSKNHSSYEVVIGSDIYKTVTSFGQADELVPGAYGIFRLSKDGKIAYFRREIPELGIGYLMGAITDKGLSAKSEIKIFTSDGAVKIYTLAEKAELDGERLEAEKVILGLRESGAVKRQIVTYKFSEDGLINYIDTMEKGINEGENTLDRHYSSYFDANGNSREPQKLECRTIGIFGGKIAIDGETKIFRVPSDPEADEENYQMLKQSYFQHTHIYDFEVFKLNAKSHIADVLVMQADTSAGGQVPLDRGISIIKKISKVYDSEKNEQYTKLTCSYEKGFKDFLIKNNNVLQNATLFDGSFGNYSPKEGDVIKFDSDYLDYITAIEPIYIKEGNKFKYPSGENSTYLLDNFRVAKGECYSLSEGLMLFKVGGISGEGKKYGYEETEAIKLSQYSIFVYDSADTQNPIRTGGATDIVAYDMAGEGSEMVIYSRSAVTGTIIIYK